MNNIKITVDGFGGDNSPNSVLEGCKRAIDEYNDIELKVVGPIDRLSKYIKSRQFDNKRLKFIDAQTVMPTDADPSLIRSDYKESSLSVGLKTLKDKSDAFVSAGNTGAITVGASTIVGRINGIKRAALCPIMPSSKSVFMLIDAGANLNCRADMLCQFAIMGSIYMQQVLNLKNPRVGLVNIGAEASKGTDELKRAHEILSELNIINFIGNIEARDIPLGGCDVAVADGFSGNMVLKTMEGTCIFFIQALKEIFMSSKSSKLAALLLKPKLKVLKEKMDYTEYGGAILMGINKPIIKAHGSSNSNAVKNAIKKARLCVLRDVNSKIKAAAKALKEDNDEIK